MAEAKGAGKDTSINEAAEEAKKIIKDNVQFGINALETLGEKTVDMADRMLSSTEAASKDANQLIGDFLSQARKVQKETMDVIRRQTESVLGKKQGSE
jgi:hypothetical protein